MVRLALADSIPPDRRQMLSVTCSWTPYFHDAYALLRDPGQRPRNTLGPALREGGNRQLAGRGVSRDIDRTGLLQMGR